jgi:hypothetical protein
MLDAFLVPDHELAPVMETGVEPALHRLALGFYTLRHTFRTIADESKDQPAVDFIMGHEVPHMSAVYRETISDVRLRAVVNHVRGWFYPPATRAPAGSVEAALSKPDRVE